MFRSGTLSGGALKVFAICSVAFGVIAVTTDVGKASSLANGTRDVVETGAGITAGSLSGVGGKFDAAYQVASAGGGGAAAPAPATP